MRVHARSSVSELCSRSLTLPRYFSIHLISTSLCCIVSADVFPWIRLASCQIYETGRYDSFFHELTMVLTCGFVCYTILMNRLYANAALWLITRKSEVQILPCDPISTVPTDLLIYLPLEECS